MNNAAPYPDYFLETAFRWFGQPDLDLYVMPILFDADVSQNTVTPFPLDSTLDNRIIKGVSMMGGSEVLKVWPVNGIDYAPLTLVQSAQFFFNLREEKNSDSLVWEETPLSRINDQSNGNRGNFIKTYFKFFTENSFVKKTGALAITAPYVIPFVFMFDKTPNNS